MFFKHMIIMLWWLVAIKQDELMNKCTFIYSFTRFFYDFSESLLVSNIWWVAVTKLLGELFWKRRRKCQVRIWRLTCWSLAWRRCRSRCFRIFPKKTIWTQRLESGFFCVTEIFRIDCCQDLNALPLASCHVAISLTFRWCDVLSHSHELRYLATLVYFLLSKF